MSTPFTPDEEEPREVLFFTFERGQLPWTLSFYPDTTCTSREPLPEGTMDRPVDVEQLIMHQAFMAVTTFQSMDEMETRLRVRNRLEAYEALQASLRPCKLSLQGAKKLARKRADARAYAAFMRTYDGCAQPLYEMYAPPPAHTDDSEDEEKTTAYWQQPVTRELSGGHPTPAAVNSSPDLFCDEVFDDVDIDEYEHEDEEEGTVIPDTPPTQRYPSQPLFTFGRSLLPDDGETKETAIQIREEEEKEEEEEEEEERNRDEGMGTSISAAEWDEEGDELCSVQMLYDERIRKRRAVRAAHLELEAMARLKVTNARRLEEAERRMATRKRAYDEAKTACERNEERWEERKRARRQLKEALEACLANTQRPRHGTNASWRF